MTPKWEEELWADLDEMSLLEQYHATSEWIYEISRGLLPDLGRRRREVVLAILATPDYDVASLAEEVGTRIQAIKRLADEGRSERRAERKRLEAEQATQAVA